MSLRLTISLAITAVVITSLGELSHAQYQKPSQKPPGRPESGEPESDDEPKGGYQQPPGRGTRQGAQNTFGIGGGEIEIPAISIKLPRIKLPSLSSLHTPPQMLVEAAVAPFVQQLRRELSFETGDGESGGPESGDPEAGSPEQKDGHQKPYQQTSVPVVHHSSPLASQMREFEAREQALTQRIDVLQNSVERLIIGLEAQVSRQDSSRQSPQELRPLPEVAPPEFPVRRTTYLRTVSNPPRLLPKTGPRPLPTTGPRVLTRLNRLPSVR